MLRPPQKDIDLAFAIQDSVKEDEKELYLECMNGRSMSLRDRGDLDLRSGCILSHVFESCRPRQNRIVKSNL